MIQVARRSIVDVYNRYSFNRQSLAYDSKGRLYHLHNARFEPGKFGQAVMVEEGTTNLVPNPLAKDNLTGIGYFFGGGSAGIIERSTSLPSGCPWLTGVKATITIAGTDANVIFKQTDGSEVATGIPVTAGATYTYSIWLYIPSDSGITQLQLKIIEWNSSGGIVKDSTLASFNTKGVWQRVVATWTLQSTTAKVTLRVRGYGTGVFYATACMLEQKPYATSFVNGTRAAERLTIPGEVMPDNEGTITLWARKNDVRAARARKILDAESPRIDWQWSVSGKYLIDFGGASLSVPDPAQDTDWHFYAVTYSGRTAKLYFDGLLVASGQATQDLKSFTTLYLGTRYAPLENNWNTADATFDDLRISNRALTDEEIAAAYQSGQPLPVDQYTTLKLPFDGPDGQRAAKVLIA